jgi:hypothetical protein
VCQVGCAVTDSFAGMVVARFWLGIGGCKYVVRVVLYMLTLRL